MEYYKHEERRIPWQLLTAPVIYAMIVPVVIFDLCLEIYHRICFPSYGIPYVRRGDHIRIDRHKLSYLDPIDKMNCLYCSYINGLMHYASEIAARTEKYWCGIKHRQGGGFKEPEHHKDFLPYGDEKAFHDFVDGGKRP